MKAVEAMASNIVILFQSPKRRTSMKVFGLIVVLMANSGFNRLNGGLP